MDKSHFFELGEAIDDCLNEFREADDSKKKSIAAGAVAGAGAGGLAYGAARKHKKTRTSVLRAEVRAENAVKGAMGKAKGATRKGLKTAADLPGKLGEATKDAAKLKATQAGNLTYRARQKVGLGYASPVTRAGRKVVKKAKGALVAGSRAMRFESLDDAIDSRLHELGSAGQARLRRVGAALKKTTMKRYGKGYTKALKKSADEADRVGEAILDPLKKHRKKQMYRAQDSANRSLKKSGKDVPRFDYRASNPNTVRRSDALINERARKNLSAAIDSQLHEFEKMSLGRQREVYPSCESPVASDPVIYPNLWLNNLTKAPKLGDEGRAVIDYKVESRSSNRRNGKPEKHSVDMKVLAIEPIKGKKGRSSTKKKNFESLDYQIDSILTEFADRNRDGGGRYVAGQSGAGVDDFRAAHGTGKRKLLKRVAGVAALAGAGGLVAGTGMGRKAASRLGNGVLRGAKKVANVE